MNSVALWLWVSSSPAWAYDFGVGIVGNVGHYAIVSGTFTTTEEAEIDAGAAAWNAGSGEILRGADWEWIRDADVTTGGRNNFRNEVYEKDQDWFDANNWTTALAVATPMVLNDRDIVFNSSKAWDDCLPSDCASGMHSLGHVAAHEFGHRIGFLHYDEAIALMNSEYANGGDLGHAKYRINEDDFAGLKNYYPGSSTGINLMLSKWKTDPDAEQDVLEVWTSDVSTADLSQNQFTGIGGQPAPILAVITGTSSASPLIEWSLSPDSTCSTTDPVIGTRTPTLGVNVPHAVTALNWDFSGVSSIGYYYLCAKIDADDSVTETHSFDNRVQSDSAIIKVVQ